MMFKRAASISIGVDLVAAVTATIAAQRRQADWPNWRGRRPVASFNEPEE